MTATHTTAYACTCGTDGTTTETKTKPGNSGAAVKHTSTCGTTCTTLHTGFAARLAVALSEVAR